jgi:hypothetical protein
LHVLLFVCAAEGSVDATKFIKDNKVDDGADHDDAKVFHDAAYTFSHLNGGVPKGASEQNVLDRFRTGLNWTWATIRARLMSPRNGTAISLPKIQRGKDITP